MFSKTQVTNNSSIEVLSCRLSLLSLPQEAASLPDHFVFIEAVIHRDDCSRELLEWGCRLAASNKRAPVRA